MEILLQVGLDLGFGSHMLRFRRHLRVLVNRVRFGLMWLSDCGDLVSRFEVGFFSIEKFELIEYRKERVYVLYDDKKGNGKVGGR